VTIYGWIFRWLGWAFGLGLLIGELTYYDDGHVDGLTRLAGLGILIWWGISWYRVVQTNRAIDSNVRDVHAELLLEQYLENQRQLRTQPPPRQDAALTMLDALKRAEDARQRGILTEAEFQDVKRQLLRDIDSGD
jgi:hypothetical protein